MILTPNQKSFLWNKVNVIPGTEGETMDMAKSKLTMHNPFIKELVFQENEIFECADKQITLNNAFSLSLKINNRKHQAFAALRWVIGTKNSSPFCVNFTMCTIVEWGDVDKETLNHFLSVDTAVALLSYMRPVVSSITGQSKYPAYYLPLVDLHTNTLENCEVTYVE